MRKVYSPRIKRSYWIGNEKSPDLLPVFTLEEVAMLVKSKDIMPDDLLLQIWETKAALGCSLEEVSQYITDKKPRIVSPNLETCKAIIESLKGSRRNDLPLDAPTPPEVS